MSKILVTKSDRTFEEIDASTEEVYIANPAIVEIDLSELSENKVLSSLYLRELSIETLDLSPLESCSNLKKLSLFDNHKLRNLDLSPLLDCQKLEELNITFENGLRQIDLSPLSKGNSIQTLMLSLRQAREQDLTALSGFTNLVSLCIRGYFHLGSIDLTPLSECTNFRNLRIEASSPIRSIDLSPLQNCSKLHQLILDVLEELEDLDLSPLSNCSTLRHLSITNCPKLKVDLNPLFWCKNLSTASVYFVDDIVSDAMLMLHPASLFRSAHGDGPHVSEHIESFVNSNGWNLICEYYEVPAQRWPDSVEEVQIELGWKFLEILDMADLIGYDRSIGDIITSLQYYDFKSGREFVYNEMLSKLDEQLNRGGTTIFMDVDKMIVTKAARLVPRILELRKEEMKRIQLGRREELMDFTGAGSAPELIIDLTSLSYTAHGYKILRELVHELDLPYFMQAQEISMLMTYLQEANLPPITIVDGIVKKPTHITDPMFRIIHSHIGWEFNDR